MMWFVFVFVYFFFFLFFQFFEFVFRHHLVPIKANGIQTLDFHRCRIHRNNGINNRILTLSIRPSHWSGPQSSDGSPKYPGCPSDPWLYSTSNESPAFKLAIGNASVAKAASTGVTRNPGSTRPNKSAAPSADRLAWTASLT